MSAITPVSFRKGRVHEPRLSKPYVPGTRSPRFWSEDELSIVRKLYPKGGVAAVLAKLPHRTVSGVYAKANQLELSATRVDRIRAPDDFDARLRAFYLNDKGRRRGELNAFADAEGMPRWWVSKRARALGLTMPHKKEPPWTARELAMLPKLPLHNPDRCADIMREHGFARSPSAIINKAKRLDLSRRYRETLSANAVAEILGVDRKTVTREILQGDLVAEKRATQRLAQQGGDPWSIRPENLRRYIIDHIERVDLRKVDKLAFVQILAAEPLDAPREHQHE